MRLAMPTFASIATATLAALSIAPLASAAVYGGFTATTGTIRCSTGVGQASDATLLATALVEIDYCTGITESIPLVPVTALQAEAIGTYARLDAVVTSSTSTTFKLTVTDPSNGVLAVRIVDGGGSKLGFDKAQPNPGTAGSNAGANLAPIAMSGTWTFYAMLTDAVALCPSLPRNDLFMSLHLRFTTCFRFGDSLSFRIDTDKVS
jgi:hypothetical protein